MIWVMIASFLLFVALGVPIAFSIGASSLIYILAEGIPLSMMAQRFFSNTQSFAFLAIPYFMLMGSFMVNAGIAQRLIKFADSLVRHFPGGLGCVSVVTNMVMAGVSGSSVADCAAVGSVLVPEMKRNGYDAKFAAALNSCTSVVGIIIPPSSTMIIIAWLTNLSIARMFMAGAIPGILISISYFLVTIFIAKRRGYPQQSRATVKEIWDGIKSASLTLILPIFLVGVIVLGIATVTEAAAASAVYALILGLFVYRSLDFKLITKSLKEAVVGTTTVMLVVCTSSVFTWVLIREGIPVMIANALLSLGLPGWALKVAMILILFAAGTVMDLVPNLFIFIPIFFPIASQLGFDPIHFSIVILISLALGLFTPPVGTTLFLSCQLADVKIEEAAKDLVPYFIAAAVIVFLVTFVPSLALWLPDIILGK
ncbi:MAG TPA: TRAP transporter large permease [Thermoanaerobacterium sp.]|nr:TRAP transporter large permease [Thermoanaerobacterium sp.]